MDITVLAIVCMAYLAAYNRVIERYCIRALVEDAGAKLPRGVPKWVSETAFIMGLFVYAAAVGVILSVILQWYWSVFW